MLIGVAVTELPLFKKQTSAKLENFTIRAEASQEKTGEESPVKDNDAENAFLFLTPGS
jgi:hypothetical protein